ncbi:MAG: alpha/beta hydrolase [Pseudomonadota bacterium]
MTRCFSLMAAVCAALAILPHSAFADAPSEPTRFLEADGIRYAYRDLGADNPGTPLILITRYRANMDDWDPAFLDALANHRRVIAFNQAGISSSGGSVPGTIKGMAADVAAFANAMSFEAVDILGWSMGGFTAQAVAVDYPDLVRKVVLIGTGPAASDHTPGPKDGVFDVAVKPSRADGKTTYADEDRAYLFFADDPKSKARAQASFDRIDAARRDDEPVTGHSVMQTQTGAIQDFWFNTDNGYFDGLSGVDDPVLIINGDNDAFFTVQAQAVLFSELPNAQLAIFPAAGHGPQHQHPNAVAETIDRFLD